MTICGVLPAGTNSRPSSGILNRRHHTRPLAQMTMWDARAASSSG
ncbi:hypothetical protein ACFPM0_18920 [Pseudonocardia sulfidoxydans]